MKIRKGFVTNSSSSSFILGFTSEENIKKELEAEDLKEYFDEVLEDVMRATKLTKDEVLKYNPEFDYHLKNKWMATWIKDFKGTVTFVVKHIDGYYEEDTDYWKKGDYWEDYVLEVVGHGINKVTGKPINFVGKQTGL